MKTFVTFCCLAVALTFWPAAFCAPAVTFNVSTRNVQQTDLNLTAAQIQIGTAGVRLTDDGDGAITFLGLGNGSDENFTLNLDDTANTITASSSTGANVFNFSGFTLQQSGVAVVSSALTLTMAGTANEITSSAGAQDLSANRTWTFSLPSALTFTGKTITGGTFASPLFTDVTTGNVSTSAHGLAPKGDGSTNKFLNANGAYSAPAVTNVPVTLGFTTDGAGTAVTTGVKGYWIVKNAFTINGYSMMTDQAGSIVIDIWMETDPFDGSGIVDNPPVVADTITASAKPTLSTQRGKTSTTLTSWTTTVPAGAMIGWNIDSASTITRFTFQLNGTLN